MMSVGCHSVSGSKLVFLGRTVWNSEVKPIYQGSPWQDGPDGTGFRSLFHEAAVSLEKEDKKMREGKWNQK